MPGVNEGPPDAAKERTVALPAKVVVTLRAGALLAVANVVCAGIIAWSWTHV